jgi:ketosteroid isomerase-like protein
MKPKVRLSLSSVSVSSLKALLAWFVLCGIAYAWLASDTKPADPVAAAKAELIAADGAFARATRARGLDGWMEYFNDKSTVNLSGTPVHGSAEIRKFYSPLFAAKGLLFEFHPETAEVVNTRRPGDLGFTTGRYSLTTLDDGGMPHTQSGSYLTVWRKQPDGRWKIVTDMGSEDPTAKPVAN